MLSALQRCLLGAVLALRLGAEEGQASALASLPGELEGVVRVLSASQPARSHLQVEALDAMAAFIADGFREAGLRPSEQEFTVDGRVYRNVIASIGPAGGARVIIGAHYDVAGDMPGADDNASGIAGLLALARRLRPQEPRLSRRIEFVAYTLEEPPHFATAQMGSAIHAQALHDQGVEVAGMICLEMIGYFSDEAGSQTYPLPGMERLYPSTGDFIAVVGNPESVVLAQAIHSRIRASGMPAQQLVAPGDLPGVNFSDHRNYWHFGYPAVMITDTAFYRNPHYHRASDLPETLDYHRMARVVQGLEAAILPLVVNGE
jgi:hypothetical protein